MSKLIISKKFKKEIKRIQKINQDHYNLMERDIHFLFAQIGLISEEDREILWDYIYNENSLVKFK